MEFQASLTAAWETWVAQQQTQLKSLASQEPSSINVLLVEDEPVILMIHTRFLEDLGYQVTSASTGTQALALLEQQPRPYDIVFMDIGLPEMSGDEVTAAYRAQETTHHLPIIALTGYGSEDHRQQFLKAGLDAVLLKPAKKAQLKQMVEQYCIPAPEPLH
jgi:two-component system sensor histidine kinase BarA